jgi:prevent-host-death family protein
MTDVPDRQLRDHISNILRRVEAGERLRVTVSGRPVTELVPLPRRPASLPWSEFIDRSEEWRADAGLAGQLRDLLPETTDDSPIP